MEGVCPPGTHSLSSHPFTFLPRQDFSSGAPAVTAQKMVIERSKSGRELTPGWESQFLGRLIRSPASPRRRKGSGALKEEIGIWNSGGGKDKCLVFLYIP